MKSRNSWIMGIGGVVFFALLILGYSQETMAGEKSVSSQEAPIGYNDNFYGVSFVNPQKGWVVGYYGLIAHTEDGGKTWIRQNCGTQDPLLSVDFVDENHGWIVGKFAKIFHTADGGKNYSAQRSEVEEDLFDVSFVDSQNGWSVGTYGTILHTSDGGKTWERQGEEVDKIYNAVFFVDQSRGWIAGEFATILHTEDGGVHWEEQKVPLGTGYSLFDIHFSNKDTGVAVGMDGAILVTKDGGTTWDSINPPPGDAHLFGVSTVNNKGWACGLRGGFVLANDSDLKHWVLPQTEFQIKFWLSDICFVDENHGWIVGAHGIIRRTADGGKTWIERE